MILTFGATGLVECIPVFSIGRGKLSYHGDHLWLSLSESKTKISDVGGGCRLDHPLFWLVRYFQAGSLCGRVTGTLRAIPDSEIKALFKL